MVFPQSYSAVLLTALLSLVLGAIWALTIRPAGKWRFELMGIDFGLGVLLSALLIGLSLGTFGEEITVGDNLMIMRKSSVGFLFGFGMLINLGLLLLLASIAVAGLAVSFLAGLSMATVVGALGMHLVQPFAGPLYLAVGSVLMLLCIAFAARAHAARARQRDTDLLQKAVAAGMKGKIQRTSPAKGLILAVAGGFLLGLAQPIGIWAQSRDEIGFGAYSIATLYALAFAVGVPFFSLFLLNLPVQGEPIPFSAWFKGTGSQHLMGLAGGALWFAGLTALLLAGTATPRAGIGRAPVFALSHASMLLGGILGIVKQGEFASPATARGQALIALGLAAAGLIAYGVSPAN